MRILFLAFYLFVAVSSVHAQNSVLKSNTQSKALKADANNQYNAEDISTLDLLHALEVLNIKIAKFNLPQTDQPRSLGIIVEEFSSTQLIESDTSWMGENTYSYWERGDVTVYKDYIDEITLITKEDKQDSMVMINIHTYAQRFGMPIRYKPASKESFYNVRTFKQGEFTYGEKMPLIAIASSWYDKRSDINRFCGKSILEVGDKDTQELLTQSPNYYIVSYILK